MPAKQEEIKQVYDPKRGVYVQKTDSKKRIIKDGHHVSDTLQIADIGNVGAAQNGQAGDSSGDQPLDGMPQMGENPSDQNGNGDDDQDGDDGDQPKFGESNVPQPQSTMSEEEYNQRADKEQNDLQQQFNNKQKLSDIFDRWTLSAHENLVYMVNKNDPSLHVRIAHSKKVPHLAPEPNITDLNVMMEHDADFRVMLSDQFRAQFDTLLENAA